MTERSASTLSVAENFDGLAQPHKKHLNETSVQPPLNREVSSSSNPEVQAALNPDVQPPLNPDAPPSSDPDDPQPSYAMLSFPVEQKGFDPVLLLPPPQSPSVNQMDLVTASPLAAMPPPPARSPTAPGAPRRRLNVRTVPRARAGAAAAAGPESGEGSTVSETCEPSRGAEEVSRGGAKSSERAMFEEKDGSGLTDVCKASERAGRNAAAAEQSAAGQLVSLTVGADAGCDSDDRLASNTALKPHDETDRTANGRADVHRAGPGREPVVLSALWNELSPTAGAQIIPVAESNEPPLVALWTDEEPRELFCSSAKPSMLASCTTSELPFPLGADAILDADEPFANNETRASNAVELAAEDLRGGARTKRSGNSSRDDEKCSRSYSDRSSHDEGGIEV
eukprot:CAMPEP_0119333344 /NCGR_PEP_ID=MMETSP1333-20130426/84974_1 /TAXON_ID=418940 /ORGANISM="Scyphosphaera apsteinii, Strain RCC1455" /LENGTH=396 /DNA_ID=CAMNT_0007343393 /DNA_START=56 /DNA_END=1242 /DNA_ORIENTATION=+